MRRKKMDILSENITYEVLNMDKKGKLSERNWISYCNTKQRHKDQLY